MEKRPDTALYFTGEKSLTKQSFKEECDINRIVKSFMDSGLIQHVNERTPVYGDVSFVPDYQTALHVIRKAQDRFEALPKNVRKRFNNSAEEFVEFMSDEGNRDEAVRLGLLSGPEVKPPDKAVPGPIGPAPTAPVVPSGDTPAAVPKAKP